MRPRRERASCDTRSSGRKTFPPRRCRRTGHAQGVEDSDLVLLILGEPYGCLQESGKSATHEEFAHAVLLGRPVLVFTMEGVTRDADMAAFVREVEACAGGQMAGRFSTAEECGMQSASRLAGRPWPNRLVPSTPTCSSRRPPVSSPTERSFGDTTLVVAVAAGPVQAIIRPAAMEEPALCEVIKQQAMFGPARVLDSDRGARCQLRGDGLLVTNDLEQILLTPAGDHMIAGPARPRTRGSSGLNPVITEEVQERIWRALRFGG